MVEVMPGGHLGVTLAVNDENIRLADGFFSAAIRPISEVNRVQIVAQGPDVAIHVNGEPLWFFAHESLDRNEGIIALFTTSGSQVPHQVGYDNLEIWHISDTSP